MSDWINMFKKSASKLKTTVTDLVQEKLITIHHRNRVNLNHYGKILKFDENILLVGDGEQVLKILGTKLVLSEMADNYMVIEGIINSIEFIK